MIFGLICFVLGLFMLLPLASRLLDETVESLAPAPGIPSDETTRDGIRDGIIGAVGVALVLVGAHAVGWWS